MKLKHHLLFWLLIPAAIYTLLYLTACFILWDFVNPFQWIIDLHSYSIEKRALILASILISYVSYYSIFKNRL